LETRSPVMMMSRSRYSSGAGAVLAAVLEALALAAGASGCATRRNSRLATLPRIRLASAVSWIPGQLDHDAVATLALHERLGDTPSSLTRLRSVVRFWLTE
jgi:uncharacterized protein HemX